MTAKNKLATILSAVAAAAIVGLVARAQNLTVKGANTTEGNAYFYQNVGIGTTSPTYKLQVIGDVYANGGWLRTSGSAGWYNESYGGGWFMQDATWIRSYGGKYVYMDNLVSIGGSLGVGTTAPAEKLEVNGSQRFSGWARIYNASSNLHVDASSTGSMYLNYYSGGAVYFGNGASGATGAWTSAGNVGIGTTTPGVRLDVVGDLRADTNTPSNCAWSGWVCRDNTCPSGKFMAGIDVGYANQCSGGGPNSRVYCCEL